MNSDLKTVRQFVASRHRERVFRLLVRRMALWLSVFSIGSFLVSFAFFLFPWTLLPFIWDGIALLCCVGMSWGIADVLLFRRTSRYATAKCIEHECMKDASHPLVSIALELEESGNELVAEVNRRAREQISRLGKCRVGGRHPLLHTIAIVGMIGFSASLFLPHPRLLSYWKLPFVMLRGDVKMTVTPGTVRVPNRASVQLAMHPENDGAPSCRVVLTEPASGRRIQQWMRPDSNGVFSYQIDSVETTFLYQFTYGTETTVAETVTVVPPPLLHGLQVQLDPPEYTRLQKKKLPPGQGDFITYPGTRIDIAIESSGLREAFLELGDTSIALATTGDTAAGTFIVADTATYTFALVDSFGQKSDSLSRFTIGIVHDEPPEVRFLAPGVSKNLEPAQKESLWVEGVDDLGIQSMVLCWYKNTDGPEGKETMSLSPSVPSPSWQRQFIWDISRLSLYPGDTLFYWAYVRDTRTFGKPQYGISDTFWFRVPTFAEIHRNITQRDAFAQERMSGVQERQKELSEQLEQLDKATRKSDEATWEQKQLTENIKSMMKDQADSLNASLQQLQENVQEMREEGALGEEIARKMNEVQKAMEELIAMYGDSLLFPQKQNEELTLSDMREAVDQLKDMLPELEERLENTLQFLETLKKDKELAMMAMRAEKLAREQMQMSNAENSSDARLRQKELLERINDLQKDIKKSGAAEKNEKYSDLSQRIDSLENQMEQELSDEKMPKNGNMQQMSGNMAAMSEQLKSMMSSHMMEQLQALKDSLLNMADAALQLTGWQEQLGEINPESEQARREQALSQQALGEALMVLDRGVDSLPMLPPSARQQLRGTIGNAVEASKAAVESMGGGDGHFGMRVSAQSLKKLAGTLMETVDAMNQQGGGSCSSGGGMQQSLRQLSGKQAAINAATAQMLRQMLQGRQPGGKTGNGGEQPGGNSEAARKAAQEAQKELAEELRKLAEKFGDTSGEGMKRRLEQLEKEARSLTKMLRQPREDVTERQDRFLARMLQSALSLHREDQGKEERKSSKAGIVFTRGNATVSDSLINAEDMFHMVRRKALQNGNYPASYRSIINTYFDSLGVLYLK